MSYERLFYSNEDRHNAFIRCWNEETKHGDIHLNEETDLTAWLEENGFFNAPASTKYHGNWEGGLFEHSYWVYQHLQALTDKLGLVWQRPESPFIIGMFHDICKCDQYVPKGGYPTIIGPDGTELQHGDGTTTYEYNQNTLLQGHGAKSVMILSSLLKLTEEEMLCIRYHMGAYEKDDWNGYDMAIRKYPNVLFVHTADMLASKSTGV